MNDATRRVFDQDVACQGSDGGHRAVVSNRWNIFGVPDGGYVMALAVNALRHDIGHPHPLTVTGHYLEPTRPGPAELWSEILRAGRGVSTGTVRLQQEGRTRAFFTAAFTHLERSSGPTRVDAQMPRIPPPQDCKAVRMPTELGEQVTLRLDPDCARWVEGETGGDADVRGWIRFSDGREADALSLLLFADAFPPAVFAHFGATGWVPTIELTVHVRGLPSPGWLLGRFRTRVLQQGFLEEDGELWDSDGRLVAMSRQMAKLRLPDG